MISIKFGKLASACAVLVCFTCTTDTSRTDDAPLPEVPELKTPLAMDSTGITKLQAGVPVKISAGSSEVTVSLMTKATDSRDTTGERIITLETGEDTTIFFRKKSGALIKVRLSASGESDSLLGTWRAFLMNISGTDFAITDDNSNAIELVIGPGEASDVPGIEITMRTSGTPEFTRNQLVNHAPTFVEDSASLSAKMSNLKAGKRYAFFLPVYDPDLSDGHDLRITVPGALEAHKGSGNDSMIWSIRTRPPDTGYHRFSATVTDGNGLSDTISWTAFVVTPLFGLSPAEWSQSFDYQTPGVLLRKRIETFTPDAPMPQFSLLSAPSGAKIEGDQFLWQTTAADSGVYQVQMSAFDGKRYDTLDFIINMSHALKVPLSLPVICKIQDSMNTPVGRRIWFTICGCYENRDIRAGDTVTFVFLQKPSLMDLTNGNRSQAGMSTCFNDTVSWTPTEADTGKNPVSIQVNCREGFVDTVQTVITVTDTNHNPFFITLPQDMLDSAIVGTEYRDTFRVVDPEGDPLWTGFSGGFVSNVQIENDSIIHFTAVSADTGLKSITVMARDPSRNEYISLTWTITVRDTNHAPVFLGNFGGGEAAIRQTLDTAYTSMEYTSELNARDIDGDFLTFSFVDSISGMVLTEKMIRWTPTMENVGVVDTVSVMVSDRRGKSDTLGIPIVVIR